MQIDRLDLARMIQTVREMKRLNRELYHDSISYEVRDKIRGDSGVTRLLLKDLVNNTGMVGLIKRSFGIGFIRINIQRLSQQSCME